MLHRFPWACLFSLLAVAPGFAQLDQVRLHLEQGAIGLDGYVRPGMWTPMRLLVDNLSADDREVVLQWELSDEDGDQLTTRRRVTLTRQRDKQPVWLYAPVAAATGRDTRWNVRAVDAESGELLATRALQPDADRLLLNGDTLIAATTNLDLGLNDYQRHEITHGPLRIVRGVTLDNFPDRWHGLEALHTFIWTQDRGGNPADPRQVSDAALAALREWVYRGGHMVVILPAVGQTWTSSPVADMLPVTAQQVRSVETTRWAQPEWMGPLKPLNPEALSVTTFDVDDEPRPGARAGANVLLRDSEGRPVAVAGRFGFGRVTLLGIDLTQPMVREAGMPNGERRLWNLLFNWQSPALSENFVEGQVKQNVMVPSHRLTVVQLGDFIPGLIAMSGTVGALLVTSLLLFGLYWLVAGWLLQPVLKRRGLERWTWVAFVGVVGVFAGIAWGGAALFRPSKLSLSHFTVLDLDGNAGVARGRAFVSVFVPQFGKVEVATASPPIPALGTASHNLLSSPGFNIASLGSGFLDPQRYTLSAESPDTAVMPMRSTTKQLVIDYLGPVDDDMPGLLKPASVVATTPITLDEDRWPVGELFHTLPGELTNVRIIYCRGEGFDERAQRRPLEPVVWDHVNAAGDNRWASNTPLKLTGRPKRYEPLTPPWRGYDRLGLERDWAGEGFLGRRLGEQQGGGPLDVAVSVDESVIARQLELLSFFGALPPPDVKRDPDTTDFRRDMVMNRRLGTRFDLTPLTQGRRLIVMGLLRDAPLPVPLTVDGVTPPSAGWTVVRWVYDF